MSHQGFSSEEEIRRIENEDGWPNWPLLPVKKLGQREIGVLWARDVDYASEGDPFDFYSGANMYNTPSTWGTPIKKTAKELVEEGWVGD